MAGKLIANVRLAKAVHIRLQALDTRRGHMADLFAVKAWQTYRRLYAVEGGGEAATSTHVFEVDEGVTHITVGLKVNRQVKEVEGSRELIIETVHELIPRATVGDALEHDGRRGH